MANVTRERTSKDGATRGLNGINIPPQKYIVEFTSASEYALDPTVILQTHADGVPLGASYEFDSFSAICTGYQIGAPLGHSGWEVYAIYTPQTIKVTGWRRNIRGFLETQHIFETVEDNPEVRKPIGPHFYLPGTGELAPFAEFTATPLLGGDMPLAQTSRRVVEGYGADVPKAGFSVYYYRDDLPDSFQFSAFGAAAVYLGKVNSGPVDDLGAPAGTVLLAEMTLDEIPGSLATDPTDFGYHYGATLRFDIKTDLWSPIRIYDSVFDDDQNRLFVKRIVGGQKYFEDYEVIKREDINNVFSLIHP